jgi:AdoMet-dependent rRNA methyltransferase SPB1
MDLQLERLNVEAAARVKRQRRRANELKAKTIRRMQLQMTTPMDIGLEQTDLALSLGQDDIFNFKDIEKNLKRKRGLIDFAAHDRDLSSESDLDQDVISDLDDDEAFTADEESEGQTVELEAELEGLYGAYQEKLKEKDAKLRAREARKKNKEREEWGGIPAAERDGDSDEDTVVSEDGGWEEMQEAKDNVGEESSSEGSVGGGTSGVGKKRKTTSGEVSFDKRVRFATDLKEKPAPSRAAQLWFSQDIFSGVKGLDLDDKGDTEPSSSRAVVQASRMIGRKQDEVSVCSTLHCLLTIIAGGFGCG